MGGLARYRCARAPARAPISRHLLAQQKAARALVQEPAIGAASGEGGAPSGYARSPLSCEAHSEARPREHVDQGVDAEAMEAPPHEVVHAGLAYPQ